MLRIPVESPAVMAALTPSPNRAGAGVSVHAAGRLHLGFLDPSASLGRRYGSVGLMIEGFATEVDIAPAETDTLIADTPAAQAELARVATFLQDLREHTGRRAPLALRLRAVLPAHAGLGSGTQLALAVGRAFARWQGLDVPTSRLGQWLGRGQRSGIGLAGFDEGGLLVDGGPSAAGAPAALLARINMPPTWRAIVVLDALRQGLSGADERYAIASLPPLPQADAADICHQVLMRILPGAANGEFGPFAAGLNRVQGLIGAHFAPAQGGSAWTSAPVGRLMHWVRDARARLAGEGAAIGQSSWGPTGFAIVPSDDAARTLVDAARLAGRVEPGLDVHIVACRNRGAAIHDDAPR